jgi:hypothetical protein
MGGEERRGEGNEMSHAFSFLGLGRSAAVKSYRYSCEQQNSLSPTSTSKN